MGYKGNRVLGDNEYCGIGSGLNGTKAVVPRLSEMLVTILAHQVWGAEGKGWGYLV